MGRKPKASKKSLPPRFAWTGLECFLVIHYEGPRSDFIIRLRVAEVRKEGSGFRYRTSNGLKFTTSETQAKRNVEKFLRGHGHGKLKDKAEEIPP